MRPTFYLSVFYRWALCLGLCTGGSASLWGQGTIRGQVLDAEFNDVLIGATVFVEGTQKGANTDLDGQFSIAGVPAGSYSLVITYVSYQKYTVTDVAVENGKVTVVNVVMEPEGTTVDEVVITAKQLEISEASLLNLQFKSSNTLDGLGSRQISRIGDSDAGGAIRRVVGVSVEGGKYVYVRGLGDRYGKTLVNGAEIPGLDPSRNSVQIDLFPTNVLDNLIIYKSFTPDLPGSFTGGLVDITTRDFPDRFTYTISLSGAYNSQSTFNDDFLGYEGSSLDILALGFSDRDIPSYVRNNPQLTGDASSYVRDQFGNVIPERVDEINQVSREFGPQWFPTAESAPLDHSLSFSMGNQSTLFGKSIGYIVGGSYRRQYRLLDGSANVYSLSSLGADELLNLQELDDRQGISEVLWSLLGNFSIKLNENNKISINLIRTQSGESRGRFLDGLRRESGTAANQEIRALDYLQRSNTLSQLRGSHILGERSWEIDWIISGAYTTNFQPDFRTWAYEYLLDDVTGERITDSYRIDASTTGRPVRFFRELEETNLDSRLNISKYFTSWTGGEGTFKFGGSWLNKIGRKFSERQYDIIVNVPQVGARSLSSFANNLEGFFEFPNAAFTPEEGTFNGFSYALVPNFINDYTAEENVFAGYAMVDMPIAPKLRLITGARFETTEIIVEPDDPDAAEQFFTDADGKINQQDVLPSLSLIYNLTEKSNLRINYGRTLARPVFREIAPFEQYDFFAGPRTVGNGNLERSLIDNIDLRYELFPTTTEVFAVSVYYKQIKNPIEKSFLPNAATPALTWQNVPEAIVYGAELDFRKSLAFLNPKWERVSLGINASYTFSEVDVPEAELTAAQILNPDISTTRELFGQSPYIVNANLTYTHPETGTTYTIAFNRFGERLILVAQNGTPNYYEQPRNSLDINVLQKLGGVDGRWTLRIGASNILNPEVRWTSEWNGIEYDFLRYKEGAVYTVGVSYTYNR